MIKYNLDTLIAGNESYHHAHGVTVSDVEKANEWVVFIEGNRNEKLPQVGDVVQLTDLYGNYYAGAHIESLEEDKLRLCHQPMIPFVGEGRMGKLITNTSGGPWSSVPSNLRYVGKQEKAFIDWGHSGPCANGAFQFYAEVNVWEYIPPGVNVSTKTHDKFYVTVDASAKGNDYKYIIKKDGFSHCAFKTDEEYQAWLNTFHGVEQDDNRNIVWTDKQKTTFVPLEEYNLIEHAVIDSELNNGSIQECKRVYGSHCVMTYMPFQHEKIELVDMKRYMNELNK